MTLLLRSTVCDKIFDHFPLLTKIYITLSFTIASSVTYSEICQHFSSSAASDAQILADLISYSLHILTISLILKGNLKPIPFKQEDGLANQIL